MPGLLEALLGDDIETVEKVRKHYVILMPKGK
jgi:hypothetical protein